MELCRETRSKFPNLKVLIFTGEILNEKLWVDVLDAGCNGIILKTDEMLTRTDVISVMSGKKNVFNQPILNKILEQIVFWMAWIIIPLIMEIIPALGGFVILLKKKHGKK